VYGYVEKYARNGDILDLGCGSGNTGSELNQSAYQSYIGVDISDVAIEKAMWRSERAGRDRKNRYVHADIVNYSPEGRYDVILFRESLYYVPRGTILKMLRRYREHLKEGGVIIVRLYDRDRYNAIHRLLRKSFGVLEEFVHEDSRTVVLVFR
jgi:2-polyprenyl-6-hydroxyphenyl methylase/3-demethylubiquinone-9 3-methyltransferase